MVTLFAVGFCVRLQGPYNVPESSTCKKYGLPKRKSGAYSVYYTSVLIGRAGDREGRRIIIRQILRRQVVRFME